jgi:hydrogenase-4 component E
VVAAAVVPLSTAVILLGALAMVVRRHTVAQLIGWLIVENGVFLGAITLVAAFPSSSRSTFRICAQARTG